MTMVALRDRRVRRVGRRFVWMGRGERVACRLSIMSVVSSAIVSQSTSERKDRERLLELNGKLFDAKQKDGHQGGGGDERGVIP